VFIIIVVVVVLAIRRIKMHAIHGDGIEHQVLYSGSSQGIGLSKETLTTSDKAALVNEV
jgi:hypothetical protein